MARAPAPATIGSPHPARSIGMKHVTDLPLSFEVRSLSPELGAEILGVELAGGVSAELFSAIYRAFLRYQVCCSVLRTSRRAAGRLRSAVRRRAGPRDEPVPRGRFPELYRLSNLDDRGKPERQASGQGHAGVAHRRLVVARDRASHDHLWRSRAAAGAKRTSATCTARTNDSAMTGKCASPGCVRCTTSISRAIVGMAGPDDRSATAREAAGRSSHRTDAPGDRPKMPLPRRPRRVHRRHAV